MRHRSDTFVPPLSYACRRRHSTSLSCRCSLSLSSLKGSLLGAQASCPRLGISSCWCDVESLVTFCPCRTPSLCFSFSCGSSHRCRSRRTTSSLRSRPRSDSSCCARQRTVRRPDFAAARPNGQQRLLVNAHAVQYGVVTPYPVRIQVCGRRAFWAKRTSPNSERVQQKYPESDQIGRC